jgi:hypothetical protein
VLLLTDTFAHASAPAAHNRMRPLEAYRPLLVAAGLEPVTVYPTHVLLNRELGAARFLNRLPWLLYGLDRALLGMGFGRDDRVSKLLVARRKR